MSLRITCQKGNKTCQIMMCRLQQRLNALWYFSRNGEMQICNASHSIDKHLSMFIAHLSTATDLTNQIMTPAESGIMDGRHENKVCRLLPLVFSPRPRLARGFSFPSCSTWEPVRRLPSAVQSRCFLLLRFYSLSQF